MWSVELWICLLFAYLVADLNLKLHHITACWCSY